MRKRTSTDPTEAIGTDSFLDIVANLVGILIILVMVIGVRAQDAWESAVTVTAGMSGTSDRALTATPAELPDVETSKTAVARLQSSIFDADLEAAKLDRHVQLQRLQRDELMLAMTNAQRMLDERRAELTEQELKQVQIDTQLHAARKELSNLQGQIESVETAEVEPSVIKHVATPLAQTVFAREEHFRLLDGRLAYVPLNELAERLKSEAPKKIWKLKEADRTTETIGPRDDFYLKYTLRRNKYVYDSGSGPGVREVVELERFVMIPASDQLGEPVEDALQPGSQLLERLQTWSPEDTIVTVWTYPDSFEQFRNLKESLYERGFLTAARPLPAGQPISGSPQGTRSAAQ